ncbi:MAG: hypothetical protein HY202_01780 [Nitrospirae bacterium]|nr:hypothetical protein [Nitrospirota bacterium]
MDLKIQRSYNGRIWGRRDVTNPGLVAYNEKSIMGLGWSFHFGRIRNPLGTGSSNPSLPNNPIIEMPDGSLHPFYQSKNNSCDMISVEHWIYRKPATGCATQYQLILTDGTVYTFPNTNAYYTVDNVLIYQVGTITSPNGNTITVSYDSTNPTIINSVTDSASRGITFSYTVKGGTCLDKRKYLTSMNVNGKVYNYSYQAINCNIFLSQVTPPVGPSWKYTYNSVNNSSNSGQYEMNTVTYPSGAVLTYGYNDIGFDTGAVSIPFTVVTSRSLSGRGISSASWTYAYAANPTNIANSTNQVTTITESGCKTERYTFFSFGSLPNSGTGINKLWQIGRLIKKEILSGATVIQTENYTWSPSAYLSNDQIGNGNWNGLIATLTDNQIFEALLASKSLIRDGKTYTTSFSNYDSYGNPQTITETGDSSRTTALTYYYITATNIVKGHPATNNVTVNGESFPTGYSYDTNGNLTQINQYGVITNYFYTNGNLTSRTDANNNSISFQYSYGVISQITNPYYSISKSINWEGTVAWERDGNSHTTYYSYDPINRITTITPPLDTATNITYDNSAGSYWKVAKSSGFTQNNVDGLGRVISTSNSEGINTQTTYNTCGQVSYKSYPYTATNIGDSFSYDVLDRVINVTHPDTKTQGYNYANGNIVITNERGYSTSYGYISFGNPDEKRLTSVVDATGTTTYSYNAVGSLKTIVHPATPQGSFQRTFVYSTKNFLTSETHPETGTITYSPDNIGNVLSRLDGRGTISYVYDQINRLTNINYPTSADNATIGYDNANNRTSLSSSAASYSYQYDAQNRLIGQTFTIGSMNFTTSYGYDSAGNNNNMTYPSTRALSYGYNTANQITSLTGYVSNVTYHPSGGIASISYANGVATSQGYDNRYRIQTINAPGIVQYTYGYDGVGNVTGITDGVNSAKNRGMGYDPLDRLTSASGVWGSLSYGYDALGNRVSQILNSTATTNYNYSSSNLLASLSGATTASYTYDLSSNMTFIRGYNLAYDYANRLTSSTISGGTVTFTYDGEGKRIKKFNSSTGKTLIYHYDRLGNVIVEADGAGVAQTEYLYLKSQPVSKIIKDNSPTVVTGSASSLSQTGATLNGTVNPNGYTTSVWFEYGLSTTYGSSTSTQYFSGTLVGAVSAVISGLSPNTIYHFRIDATNSAGTNRGLDFTFTTLASPPVVTTAAASGIALTTATLNGSVNTNGVTANGWFEYGTTTATQALSSGTNVSFSQALTGLTANTLYHFRAGASNTGGTGYGSDATFTTPSVDLVVSSLSAATSATVGTSYTVTDTVTNLGISPTGAGGFVEAYYLSSTSTFSTATATWIGYRWVDTLGAGGSSTATTTFTMPNWVNAGTYYLIANADDNNVIAETNENNNTLTMTGTVIVK